MYESEHHPPLPSHERNVWNGGPLHSPVIPMQSVSVGGGMMVAVGDAMHLKRPGAKAVGTCKLPPDEKPFHVVAVEPWAPRRFAVASEEGIKIFGGSVNENPEVEVTLTNLESRVTHLAWGRVGKAVTLYFLKRDGTLGLFKSAEAALGGLTLPHLVALTGNSSGSIAVLESTAEDTTVYVTSDGRNFVPRTDDEGGFDPKDPARPEDDRVYLAMEGDAVAYSLEPWGIQYSGRTRVSWGRDEDFVDPKALWGGALCFQNAETLIGAYCIEKAAMIFRETRKGEITRLLESAVSPYTVLAEKPLIPITELAWDATRRWLFGASPVLGCFRSEEPTPKGHRQRAQA